MARRISSSQARAAIRRAQAKQKEAVRKANQAINDYNTYTMVGLPKHPITNPGRASIEAVLNPAKTDALYMVADGTGGHAFAGTLARHNENVKKWFAIRRARGEL